MDLPKESRRTPATLLVIALAATIGPLGAGHAEANRPVLYVQPLGRALPAADVALVKQALEAFYDFDVRLLPRVDLPKSSYYRPRRRYRAEKLLAFLQRTMPEDGRRILGLTSSDISTTKGKHHDWGILGLATIDGAACVISSFRTRKGARNREHARIRLAKTAVHEIGHTLGLEHCPTRDCLLQDARGKVATSDRERDLCPRCRAKLESRGWTIPARPSASMLRIFGGSH